MMTQQPDRIRQYLRRRGCSPSIVKGGLDGLLKHWQGTVDAVGEGYDLTMNDYRNDMDTRDILAGVLEVANLDQRQNAEKLIDRLDRRFRELTIECGPIGGEEIATENGHDPAEHWWFSAGPEHQAQTSRRNCGKPACLSEPGPILLYDGVCALCNWAVKLVLRFDHHRTMRFAALASPAGQLMLANHPSDASIDSIVLIEGDRVSVRSTAILRIFRYLGGVWKILLVGYLVPKEIRDSLYDVVAYWRYRLFGKYEACPLPPVEARGRFL